MPQREDDEPLLIAAAGHGDLAATGGASLATDATYAEATEWLAKGEPLLLYTDGIIERPGVHPGRGCADLADADAEAAARLLRRIAATPPRTCHLRTGRCRVMLRIHPVDQCCAAGRRGWCGPRSGGVGTSGDRPARGRGRGGAAVACWAHIRACSTPRA